MSIGNLKDSGNQGNNMPWQWQVLKGLQAILDEVAEPLTCLEDSVTICSPTGGLDVNVHDALGNNITSTTIGADTGLDVNIIGGVTLTVNLDALDDQVGIYGYTDVNDPTSVKAIKVDTNGVLAIQDNGSSITIDATALPLPTGAATEATLLDVKTSVQLLDDCVGTDGTAAPTKSLVVAGVTASGTQQTIEVNASGHVNISDGGGSITVDGGTGVSRTPTFLRPTTASPGTGTVNTGAFSASFASVGTANALVGGMVLKPGETLNFDAGAINNTLAAITYNVTTNAGAELIIITLT
jgi:hypothetical protein